MEKEWGKVGGKGGRCLVETRRPRCRLSSLNCEPRLWGDRGNASQGTLSFEPQAGPRGSEETFVAERGEIQCRRKDL